MTILNNNTMQGLEYGDLTPSKKTQMLDKLKVTAEDQAVVFKNITDINPPNSTAPYVAAHSHDAGSNPISAPILQVHIGLSIGISEQATNADEGWQTVAIVPFYVALGITKLRVLSIFGSAEKSSSGSLKLLDQAAFRFQTTDDNLDLLPNIEVSDSAENDFAFFEFTPQGNAVNTIIVKALISPQMAGRRVESLVVTGQITDNNDDLNAVLDGSDDCNFPSSSQYNSSYFTSFDDAMFNFDMPVSSYILASLSLNNQLLSEVLTGNKSSGRSSKTMQGHNHLGHATDPNNSGTLQTFNIASWNYGAALGRKSVDTGIRTDDSISYFNFCSGTTGITFKNVSTFETFAEHQFTFQGSQNSKITGATTNISASFVALYDSSKSGSVTFEAQILSTDLLSGGNIKTVTASISGDHREIITIDNLDFPNTFGGYGEGEYVIRFRAKQASAVIAGLFIYSSCIYLK